MSDNSKTLDALEGIGSYEYGWSDKDVAGSSAQRGLTEAVVRDISSKKNEPQWMLDWRLEAYRVWKEMDEPTWAKVSYPKIDFQSIHYYAAPKRNSAPKSLDEIDPKLLETYAKLGIPLKEQEILAGVRKQGEKSHLDEEGNEVAQSRVAVDAVLAHYHGRRREEE